MKNLLTAALLILTAPAYCQSPEIEARADARVLAVQAYAGRLEATGVTSYSLLLGDSIAASFPWTRLCGGYMINGGVGGARTATLLQRIDGYLAAKPQVVIISIGVNDSRRATMVDFETWQAQYRQLVDAVAQSGVTIILETVLPVERAGPLGAIWFDSERIRLMNRYIRTLAPVYGAVLNDQWAVMERGGFMIPSYTKDGVHPTVHAYAGLAWVRMSAVAEAWKLRGRACSGSFSAQRDPLSVRQSTSNLS